MEFLILYTEHNQSMKALVIDDDIGSAIEYERILDECGVVDVSVINDLASAKIKLETESPDITILDVYLKDEIGFDIISTLKEKGSDVILVTGYPKKEIVQRAIESGVDGFIPKPIDPHTLLFQVQLIAKRRAAALHDSFCFVKSKNNYKRIPYNTIHFLETEGNYTSIITATGKFILKKSMKNVSIGLPDNIFTRVHRNFMINNDHVKTLDMKNNKIEMENEVIIQIGGKYRNDIKKAIGGKFNVI